jgi:hypothetical protein
VDSHFRDETLRAKAVEDADRVPYQLRGSVAASVNEDFEVATVGVEDELVAGAVRNAAAAAQQTRLRRKLELLRSEWKAARRVGVIFEHEDERAALRDRVLGAESAGREGCCDEPFNGS